ncbi:hypothetical protein UFOVP671_3 [uncultured Caudovirales phage]|uniref:Uncharacterized protein n=1 Tax=uncultured Caudovirales phage TaxID=2100421 RepID=A0A6J5NE00_9CAUD|nr:hypothetical protein UFOVP671_3 [uncultured Caudovirales phage]
MITKANRGNRARIVSIPAPVGGWNARDPLPNMKPEEAVSLENFYCTPYDVMVRYGYSIKTSGFPGKVETLSSYRPTSGSSKLFAFSSTNVYDSSGSGSIGSPVITGNDTNYWTYVNFGTGAGVFQILCGEGVDLPLVYNGSKWGNIFSAAFNTTISTLTSASTTATATMSVAHNLKTGMSVTIAGCTPAGYNGTYIITVTGATTFTYTLSGALGVVTVLGTATPDVNFAITGVNPALFTNVMVFKTRLWFTEKSSLKVWYMPTTSIGGAANSIDFSPIFTQGGYVIAMADWSLDAGQGMDDYAAFVSSAGQVAIYKGTDPASSATWSLVGVFDLGSPIGKKCLKKYAGDVTMINQDGVQLLSKSLMSTRVNSKESLTDKINYKASDAISQYGTNQGWQVVLFPKEDMLLLNIPQSSTESIQYVMNTINGSWSSFSGWNAACFELHDDLLYFGGADYVATAWDGSSDNSANINFNCQQSYNYCGSHGFKKVNMMRPIVSTDGNPAILLGANSDYEMSDPVGIVSFSPTTTSTWDGANWDFGIWGGSLSIKRDWQTAFTIGYAISAHMKGQLASCYMRWASTDIMVEDGGYI